MYANCIGAVHFQPIYFSTYKETMESKFTEQPIAIYQTVGDIFLCNWHILLQNALYLYLGKSKHVQDNHYKWLNWRHEDYSRTAQEKCKYAGLDTSSTEARSVEIH